MKDMTEINKKLKELGKYQGSAEEIWQQAQSELLSTLRPKDHEIAQSVNKLTEIAKTFGHTQQLREHISREVLHLLDRK